MQTKCTVITREDTWLARVTQCKVREKEKRAIVTRERGIKARQKYNEKQKRIVAACQREREKEKDRRTQFGRENDTTKRKGDWI